MVMANRTIREFSAPSAANVATGPDVINVDTHFELKLALIMMVQASLSVVKPTKMLMRISNIS